MNENNLDFLDLLNIISIGIQIQNQKDIAKASDIQDEINRAVDLINEHLQMQDKKIDEILRILNEEKNDNRLKFLESIQTNSTYIQR